jgi:glyoxylase-like metal-dependent hydrolase (beta-lactamase superfamily II)
LLAAAQVYPADNATVPARAPEALPVITFADSATLHFNGDDLEFTHLPNAHTGTDVAVRFRKANVVHMGDTFTAGFPFIDGNTGGSFDGLILAQEKMLTTVDGDTRIIRGHGPLGNKAELQAYHDMLVVVRDRVASLVKAGKSQGEVVAARPTKEFEQKYASATFNAAQWLGRAYVDQKKALEKRKKK